MTQAADKVQAYQRALVLLARAQECLRQAQEALKLEAPIAAAGSLGEAQRALSELLWESGHLAGRHAGGWSQ